MESNISHIIPFLSKELNLLGYPELPYRINIKHEIGSEKILKLKTAVPDTDTDTGDLYGEICFNNKRMVETLVNVCNGLVKDLKMHCFNDFNSDECDRIKFEKCNLQKKINSLKAELEKKMKIISTENEKSRELMAKVNELKRKVKALEKENLKIVQHSQLNEEITKHKNKKIERDLFELQKILYKQLNVVDTKYLPQNFQVLNPKSTDLNKLWCDVKYSSANNKEIALKKAVCIFEENNEILLAENSSLKTLLFVTLEEINQLIEYLSSKMNMPCARIDKKDMNSIFLLEAALQLQRYKEHIQKFLGIFYNTINCVDKLGFFVGDKLFVCLTDVINEIKNVS